MYGSFLQKSKALSTAIEGIIFFKDESTRYFQISIPIRSNSPSHNILIWVDIVHVLRILQII